MRIVKRLGWSLILLVVALFSLAFLNPVKLALSGFCKYDLKMASGSGEPWGSYASDYDFRDIPPPGDDIRVSYDWENSFCSPTNVIPLRIHLNNTMAGQDLQFGVDIRVEAPTGIIVGYLPNGTYVVKLAMYKGFDATVEYTPPDEWQGYDLRIHPVVWMNDPGRVVYYQPFLAWTFASFPAFYGSVQSVIRLGFYVITLAPLLPVITPECWKEKLARKWEKFKWLWKVLGVVSIFGIYVCLWLIVVAIQYAHP